MAATLKWTLWMVGILVAGLCAALAYVAATFDPNDYKDAITGEVEAATGRQLTLGGPIALSLFPWLGATAEDLRLANAEGFGDRPFLALERVDVRLRLWPLLRGEIRVGLIELAGLELNLARDADGRSNWDDLLEHVARDRPGGQAPRGDEGGELPPLSIAGVEIEGALIRWDDAGAVTEVRALDLALGEIGEGIDSRLRLSATANLPGQLELTAELSSGLKFTLAGPDIRLSGLAATLSAAGPTIPGASQRLTLAGDAHYAGASQTATFEPLQLGAAAMTLHGRLALGSLDQGGELRLELAADDLEPRAIAAALALPPAATLADAELPPGRLRLSLDYALAAENLRSGRLEAALGELRLTLAAQIAGLISAPTGEVELALAPLDLRAFLSRFGLRFPDRPGGGPTALEARAQLTPAALRIPALGGQFDGETLAGTLSLSDYRAAAPALRMDLQLAKLDADRWMGQGEQGGESAAGRDDARIDEMELPMEWARDLNLTARAEIGELRAFRLMLRKVLWTADGRPGTPVRQRFGFTAYGGEVAANSSVDVLGSEPKLGLSLGAKAVGIGDLLKDGWGSQWVTGTSELNLDLRSSGSRVGALRRTLNGEASYRLTDGSVQGYSLLDLVRGASAKLQGGKAQEADAGEPKSTEISELFGRLLIENGRARVGGLGGGNSWLKFDGGGWIDLVQEKLDLALTPLVLKNERTKSEPALARLAGLALPLQIRGDWAKPDVRLDLDRLLKERARAALGDKLERQKEKVGEEVQDKLGDLFKRRD